MAVVTPVNENRVQQRPVSRQPVEAARFDTGQTLGAAVAQLGQQGQEFAEQQNELNIRYAQTAARDARTRALIGVSEIRSRVTQTRMLEAEAARQQGETQIDELRREISGSLQDPVARRMFEDSFDQAVSSDRIRMREHADTQIRAAEDASDEATVNLATQRAVDLHGDPDAVAAERGTIEQAFRRRLRGAPEPMIQEALLRAYSTIHRQTALAIISTDDPESGIDAMQYVREHAAEITAEHETSLFQMIQPQFDSDVVEAGFGEVISGVQAEADTPTAQAAATVVEPVTVSGREYSPTRGIGRVSERVAGHVARSGRQALDIAAPPGTPIYPPTTGEVIEAPREQRGPNGYMVRIRHADGKVTTYLHLRAPSPLSVGDQVGPNTIIGAVGSTGRSSGNHVDFSVRDANGRELNPETVTWTGERLEIIQPERRDLAQLYARAHTVAQQRQYNSRQYNALLRRIDQHVGRQENLVERAQEEVDRRVLDRVAEIGGDNLNNVSQVPEYGNASPGLRLQIQNMIEQNQREAAAEAEGRGIRANGEQFAALDDAAYGTPEEQEEFRNVNIDLVTGITPAERVRLRRRQNELTNRAAEAGNPQGAAAVQLGRVGASVNRVLQNPDVASLAGIRNTTRRNNDDNRRLSTLRDQVAAIVQQEQERMRRPLTDQEIDNTVRMMVTSVGVRGTNERIPLYEARRRRRAGENIQAGTPVPSELIPRLIQELRNRGYQNPTQDQIAELYRRSLIYRSQ